MWNQIKVLQIGCKNLAKYTMKYVFDHGAAIVSAIDDDTALIGKDIGTLIDGGIKGPIIYGKNQLEQVLKASRPDVAIIDLSSSIKDIKDLVVICLSYGINVIANCEELFLAEVTNQTTFKELDKLAKQNKCSVLSSGYIDFFITSLVNQLVSSTNKIQNIRVSLNSNILDEPISSLRKYGIGLKEQDFSFVTRNDNKSFDEIKLLLKSEEYNPSNLWIAINWIAKKLSLNITSIEQKFVPIILDHDLIIEEKGINLPKGYVTGITKKVTAITKEGISFDFMEEEKIYEEKTNTMDIIFIDGEPKTSLNINNPDKKVLSSSIIVNRIPSIIDSDPGVLNTCKIEEAYHFIGSIDKYIDPTKRKK